ncbi:hypothetical protein DFA_05733 [Cavenderia fasciculata]|uniref:Methyltransferase domain-containing protein n=1 Tax=Cavenderia fasciculata TaxID=261658 RepID=F4PM99_CACFS|nr:uncharacterized protein DFA_05733 [Cavenderia fasciculata]EGG23599.1 hypothetical protein DFA_05733 [Cavenderia fasciculata]|eukprot:XP_004361450.1 hypothetical protein DFA_05733 [Cavenderia fasciculata]
MTDNIDTIKKCCGCTPPSGDQQQQTQSIDLSVHSHHGILFKWIEQFKFSYGVIDLRDTIQYQSKHIKHTTSIPFNELPIRIFELPPRGQEEEYIVTKESLQQVMNDLAFRSGYIIHFVINLEDDSHLWQKLTKLDLVQSGSQSRLLWQACSFLTDSIQEVEDSLRKEKEKSSMTTTKESIETIITALDLGCGSGRDCLYLAQRGGWTAVGVDNSDTLLSKMTEAANRYNLSDRIQSYNIDLEPVQSDEPYHDTDYSNRQLKSTTKEDLEKLQHLEATLLNLSPGQEGYELVNVARYLYRPLLPIIASIVKPGGFVLYHTFMVPSNGKPKRPRFLLNYNELKERFLSSKFEIIKYQETKLLEDGRPVQFLLARKPIN